MTGSIEVTQEMIEAGNDAEAEYVEAKARGAEVGSRFAAIYRAMHAARPKTPMVELSPETYAIIKARCRGVIRD